ncbi:hypothetical protein [Mycoplasmopsis alligatoris]|uniref:Uncharacterized protein n=1 Tax=Mycoplasmopsis alligatoris A21JP2 TaxID=747682 RepID=D4XUY0_9BACT|nr:hypothetical protein [Mycoplasmopsis alligatoris]EFF41826.1 hypothetical protein MALL_0137 [Mycoplasmopsis alligatoris A21JP2]
MKKNTKKVILASSIAILGASAIISAISATYKKEENGKITYLNRLSMDKDLSVVTNGFELIPSLGPSRADKDPKLALDGKDETSWGSGSGIYPEVIDRNRKSFEISFNQNDVSGRLMQIIFKDKNVTQISLDVLGEADKVLLKKERINVTSKNKDLENYFVINFDGKLDKIKKLKIHFDIWSVPNNLFISGGRESSFSIKEIKMFEGSINLDYYDKAKSNLASLSSNAEFQRYSLASIKNIENFILKKWLEH